MWRFNGANAYTKMRAHNSQTRTLLKDETNQQLSQSNSCFIVVHVIWKSNYSTSVDRQIPSSLRLRSTVKLKVSAKKAKWT